MIILGTNSIKDTGGYQVANSCRFDDGDGAYLEETASANSGEDNASLSFWFKLGNIKTANNGGNIMVLGGTTGYSVLQIYANKIYIGSDSFSVMYPNLVRDPSAWYHLFIAFDSTQGTDTNRVKPYLNGILLENVTGSTDYPAQNENLNLRKNGTATRIGSRGNSGDEAFDGYLAEFHFLDGVTKAHTDFGEFDEDSGIWKPKEYTDGSYGTNGFYLDFEDSSALGNDAAGSNNFSVTNLAATDQSTDTCTNNFATMNPLDNFIASATFTEGNTTTAITSTSIETYNLSTIGVSSGKWYAECKVETTSKNTHIGIVSEPSKSTGDYVGIDASGYGYAGGTVGVGNKWNNGSQTSYANNYTTNDIIGVAMDLDNNKIYFSKNGTFQNSGDPTSGSTGTGAAFTITASSSTPDGVYYFAGGKRSNDTVKLNWNFGSPSFAISSGNTDGDGYGNFEYAVPSGYFSLCTKNLAEYGG